MCVIESNQAYLVFLAFRGIAYATAVAEQDFSGPAVHGFNVEAIGLDRKYGRYLYCNTLCNVFPHNNTSIPLQD